MSAQQVFAHCFDCQEIGYGISDSNGVFTRDSGSSNHWDHTVHVFRTPNEYSPPLRKVLASLHGGLPISVTAMQLMTMAVRRGEIVPNGTEDREAPLEATVAPDRDERWNERFHGLLRLLKDPVDSATHCDQCDRKHQTTFRHCAHCGLASRFINSAGQCLNHRRVSMEDILELPGQTNIFDHLDEVGR